MYKLLLCWRYLLTRYIAFVSIISVMLGVATMIVVNAVMLGFVSEMKDRLHGIQADVIFQSTGLGGFPDADWHIAKIREVVGDMVEEMTPTIYTPGMMTFRHTFGGEQISQPVEVFGIDVKTHGNVSAIRKYLLHPENREKLSFDLHDGGYDVQGAANKGAGVVRMDLHDAGWIHRKFVFTYREERRQREEAENQRLQNQSETSDNLLAPQEITTKIADEYQPVNPYLVLPQNVFDPMKEQNAGAYIGIGLTAYPRVTRVDPSTGEKKVFERLALVPGDDITLTFPTVGKTIKLQDDRFTVTDLYESKMFEYDSKLVYVPLEKLQELMGMYDPQTRKPKVTQILIKANPGVSLEELRDKIRSVFPEELYHVGTWMDEKAPILQAAVTELSILNVLLFLIFANAGFGILAIFYMIVVEKTKDIGILKSLGAGSSGVMQIFLCYSLLLGIVGAGGGLIVGLLFVKHIKEIAAMISYVIQHDVFDPSLYSFYEIPTIVDPLTVTLIIAGALSVAVAAGVLPALHAARMHPVESLRG